ncbi:hypothetical protein DLM46_36755 [Paraburkholderia lacunae]|uniref:Uncharacterized protein n=1 Tax=Paraburkholderia lacunae TaxID=2211104 RepID=A0A370MWG2_9BURK|nr:hypothetical protein DLM46_36755 [Paraburkholderia lacunae]
MMSACQSTIVAPPAHADVEAHSVGAGAELHVLNDRCTLADSTGGCNTLETAQAVGVLQMKQRRRIYYSETQKALMWERWQKGDPHDIPPSNTRAT